LDLRRIGRVRYTGDPAAIRANARALVAQALAWHAPGDLTLALCVGAAQLPEWEWATWAPHAAGGAESGAQGEASGPARGVAQRLSAAERMLGDALSSRSRFGFGGAEPVGPAAGRNHILVVLDGAVVDSDAQLAAGLVDGVTVLDLQAALPRRGEAGTLALRVGSAAEGAPLARVMANQLGEESAAKLGGADALSIGEARVLARTLAPSTLETGSVERVVPDLDLSALLGIGDPEQLNPAAAWYPPIPRAPRDHLRTPIGVGPDGQRIELDIKESAQGGMGPHGLVIGATGSGKSELLRTLVLGLAITHPPELLNFVLVDFKGGATFASLDALPHTSAVITNLSDNLLLVDRMRDALAGELSRRQEALRDAGNFASRVDYERARAAGAPLEPMPSLFVVVDEFSELLSSKPDFIDLFVQIGRLGRSLGVHLLLASQRLEEGRLRGLDTYLSYRIGLRTFSAAESRAVLGVPDAYELPTAPGHGYLKIDTTGLIKFRAAYASGPVARQVPAPADGEDSAARAGEPGAPRSLMDVLIGRLTGHGAPARQVWLPPLDLAPTLDQLLGAVGAMETAGAAETTGTAGAIVAAGSAPAGLGPLAVPIGLIDRPFEQRRDPLWVDLTSSHLLIVGGPQSGKSTALRTTMAALACTHTPAQVQMYALDFGGGTLGALAGLPHLGSVASRLEPDRIRRTIAEVTAMLDQREALFAEHRIDSMATYRQRIASGQAPVDAFGDVFLIVDGWGTMRAEQEALDAKITQLAARGLGFGVHIIITAARWMEVRPALKDLIATRLELRLGDPGESEIDRRAAADVPQRRPGRGLSADRLHLLTALPRIDGSPDPRDLADGVAALVARVAGAWSGPPAPPVRLLPTQLPFAALPGPPPERAAVAIGIEEATLGPVWLDFDAEPHFLIYGDVESGKSNLLRAIAAGISARWAPDRAKIIAVDYRRGLVGAAPPEQMIAQVRNSTGAPDVAANIAAALRERSASVAVDPGSRTVATWAGSRLFLLIDDYDLVSTSTGNPLLPIVEFIPQARDIGFHVIVARASAGAGRAAIDPLLQRVRDSGSPGLLLSGSREEGAILGSIRMETFPVGRGRYVHRRVGDLLVQTARMDD
ncbi:MAG: type VII secretion protein EccCb, partial [Frankiaceae bacterium]|nr:type VII secretion protein EccCb [Frankiaceae bacterium]